MSIMRVYEISYELMQKNITITHNYANALLEVLKDSDTLNDGLSSLQRLRQILSTEKELYNIFSSPIIDKTIKLELINSITNTTEIVKNFLAVLIKNHREEYFFDILEHIQKLIATDNNIKILTVVSANEIEHNDRKIICELLEDCNLSSLKINYKVDDTLLGGIILKHGSNQIDYSLKGCIETLKNISSRI